MCQVGSSYSRSDEPQQVTDPDPQIRNTELQIRILPGHFRGHRKNYVAIIQSAILANYVTSIDD